MEFFRWIRDRDVSSHTYDVAFWMIHANSGTVQLSPRDSSLNESDLSWVTPSRIGFLVDGICERLNALDVESKSKKTLRHAPIEKLIQDFNSWVETAVMASFATKTVATQFKKLVPIDSQFAIAVSYYGFSIGADDLNVIWHTKTGLTSAGIRSNQRSLPKRGVVVKKKPPKRR